MNKMFDLLSAVASASPETLPSALDAARAFVRACEDEGRVLSREEDERRRAQSARKQGVNIVATCVCERCRQPAAARPGPRARVKEA